MIRVLQAWDEVLAARRELEREGLSFRGRLRMLPWQLAYALRFRARLFRADLTKSWDVWHAVEILRAHAPPPDAPVLDMGCYGSEVLWSLRAAGWRDLWGCDLNPLTRLMPHWHRIHYLTADLTRVPLPDRRFAAITCLSVVEHGVPLEALVPEVKRLLRPGGVFILTTDFDGTGAAHEIDPAFRVFEQSWRIFDRGGFNGLGRRFLDAGFTWLDPTALDVSHRDRPIHWNNQDYTFALAALRAPA